MFKGITLLILFAATSTQAGVYKCEMPGGRIAYQDRPCADEALKSQSMDLPQRSLEGQRRERWERDLLKWRVARAKSGDAIANNALTDKVWQVDVYLKTILKDPDSLQYIDWSEVLTEGESYLVRCRYRAKNSFGGYGVSEEVFHLDSTGNVSSVVPYQPGKSLPAHFY